MASSVKKRSNDYAQEVANQFIEQLQQGTAPWQKPWEAGQFRDEPHNPINGHSYHGINSLVLSNKEYDDPRWMTYKQAKEQGYQVRKDEKGTQIEYWQWTKDQPVIDENGEVQTDAEGNDKTETIRLTKPNVFYATVFNAEQMDGVPAYVPARDFDEPHKEAEKVLASLGVEIKHNKADRAFYNLVQDQIALPPKAQFNSKESYYAAALHELGHATGHETRLNRDMSGGFGSANYAKEELRAEIASYMLTTKLGLGYDPAPHASYVEGWIKALKDDPREIFRAASDAERIQTYLLQPEKRQKLEQSAQNISEQKTERMEQMHQRYYIKIDYDNTEGRAEAKELGAKYDREARSWYVPEGKEPSDFAKWQQHDPLNKPTVDPQVSFRDFMQENGFAPKGDIMFDNQWHDVPLEGQKSGKASGSYRVFGDAVKTLVVQNHKSGEQFRITHTGQELTAADRRVISEQREQQAEANAKARAENYNKAAGKAKALYSAAPWADKDHAYLQEKGVGAFGLKETRDGSLAIPMRNIEGKVRSMQFIDPEGKKRFMFGGQKTGNMHLIDPEKSIREGKAETILIAEGYATGATLHQVTGKPVAVAFDAGNMQPVAEAIRERNPRADIVLMADNDHTAEINDGLDKAGKAAEAVDGRVALPFFTEAEKQQGLSDWNDLAQSRGKAAAELITRAVSASQQRQNVGMEV